MMLEEWEKYKREVYTEGMSNNQECHTHLAFFSGALVTLKLMNDISLLPEEEAVKKLRLLTEEVVTVCGERAIAMKMRS